MATSKDLGALVGQIGADIREWEKAALTINNDLDQIERHGERMSRSFSKSLDDVGKKMQQTGKRMTMSISAPLAAVSGLAIREFGKFDASMNKSVAIMGDVSDTMRGQMSQAAREVGRTMSLSAKEAADSYFFLASAGLNAEQSMAALPQVAQFAQAGMFDMATATDLATDAQSALGLTVDDTQKNLNNLTRVTDVLVKANTLANATVEQFSTSLTREAGSALKSFNKDIEEGVAVLAAFADQGIKGEIAGTGLSRIIRLMTQAANNNQDAMRKMGLRVFDADGKMRNLADIIENLEDSLGDMSDQQRTAALESIGFTARVQGMILPLLGTSDAIREYEGELRKAGGTTKEIADNQMKSFNEQLSLLWDNIKDVGIEFGKTLEPAMRSMIKWTQGLVKSLQEMNEGSRMLVVVLTGMGIALGPVLWGLGSMARSLSALITFLPKVTKAFGALNLMIRANPWVLAATAVGGLAAILIGDYLTSTDEAITATNDFEEAMAGSTKSVQDAAKALEDMTFAQMFNSTNKAIDITQKKMSDLEKDLRADFAKVQQAGADAGRSFIEWVDYVTKEFGRTDTANFLGLQDQLQSLKEQRVLIKDLNELERQRTNVINSVGGEQERLSGFAREQLVKQEQQIDLIRTQLGLSTKYTEQEETTTKVIDDGNESLEERVSILDKIGGMVPTIDLTPIQILDQALLGLPISVSQVDGAMGMLQEKWDNATTQRERDEIQLLIDKLKELRGEMEGGKEDGPKPPEIKEWTEFSEELANNLVPQISSALGDIAGSFIQMATEAAISAGSAKSVFLSVLSALADLAIRVGKIAIGVAVAIEAIKKALETLNPVAAFAAGAALIGLGTWAKSALSKAADKESGEGGGGGNIHGMAMGGTVPSGFPNDTYPAMLTSGETVYPPPGPLPGQGVRGNHKLVIPVNVKGREIARVKIDYDKLVNS